MREYYERYGYAIHRRCLRWLGSQAAADDALQEVFVRVLRYGHSFNGARPMGWLYGIADRHCLDQLKRRNKARQQAELHRQQQVMRDTNELSDAQRARLVGELLSRCHPKIAETAALYYLNGLSQQEIAQRLNCSREAIAKRLKRFREQAQSLLHGDADRS